MIINVLQITYLFIIRPFEDSRVNRLEIFNEYIFSLATLHMVLFSDCYDNSHMKYSLGWTFISLILLQIVVNFYVLISSILKNVCLYFKYGRKLLRKKIKRKYKIVKRSSSTLKTF